MTNIPYSVKSLVNLAHKDTRRGRDLSQIVPGVASAVNDLKSLREDYQQSQRRNLHPETRKLIRQRYYENRGKLRTLRDDLLVFELHKAMTTFESQLTSQTFSLGLSYGPTIGKRQTYRVADTPHVAFPTKQAAAVIRRVDFAENPSRNSIIRALKETLDKNYHYAVYRIDIAKYFDSIPHNHLVKRLTQKRGIDKVTFYLIDRLLREYVCLSGNQHGVPQGVNLSSELAEFYLRDFDSSMKTLPGVLFYARYVDDIIFVVESESILVGVIADVATHLDQLGLKQNEEKSQTILADDTGTFQENETLQYLGYTFQKDSKRLVTGLSQQRVQRREARLRRVFEVWANSSCSSKRDTTGIDGLLVDRVRYLAGNTKLINSKSNVSVGLYFSNSSLDPDAAELSYFDQCLSELIQENRKGMSETLVEKLSGISFKEMFASKVFLRFGQNRLSRIVQCWRDLL